MKMNEFPTCNRKAPAAPYYAALHSMNRGPEGRQRGVLGMPRFTFHHGLNIFESTNAVSWMLLWMILRGVA